MNELTQILERAATLAAESQIKRTEFSLNIGERLFLVGQVIAGAAAHGTPDAAYAIRARIARSAWALVDEILAYRDGNSTRSAPPPPAGELVSVAGDPEYDANRPERFAWNLVYPQFLRGAASSIAELTINADERLANDVLLEHSVDPHSAAERAAFVEGMRAALVILASAATTKKGT